MCHGCRSLIDHESRDILSQYDIDVNEYIQLATETFGDFATVDIEQDSSDSIY